LGFFAFFKERIELDMYDVIIIGAGVVGALIARECTKYQMKVCVLEKENDIGNYQTLANSAIIHSGHDPKPGTLKARLCVEGNARYRQLELELGIPLLKTGAFVVAHNEIEESTLNELYHRAMINGVGNPHFLTGEEAKLLEPNLDDSITKVLSLPSTKVTFPWEVAIASMENAIHNGATLFKNAKVVSMKKNALGFIVTLEDGRLFESKLVIGSVGVYSDYLASMVEEDTPYIITPRRGEYFVLDRNCKGFVNHVIYPVPNELGKGVLVVPQTHGNILLGPTSSHQEDKDKVHNTKDGLRLIKHSIAKLVKNVPYDKIIRTFSGVRATSTYDDFYIKESNHTPGYFHVAGIDSPGLTAAPAIAKYLLEEILLPKYLFKKNPNFNPIRKKPIIFYDQTEEAKQELIKQNPLYGNLICKCEKITEAEIVDAIHAPCGADTVKGIKKRARAGSGFCQGGYCESLVLKIIARKTNTPLEKINYYQLGTPILKEETKVRR